MRFDFSHYEAVTQDELDQIEALANREIISDAKVRHYETSKAHAESIGAIAFFGDKYGDIVRVLEAGEHSIELCGGTHVHALGFIGPIKIVSEGSIGANLRRIEAVTGEGALDRVHEEEVRLRTAAGLLNVGPAEVPERIERLLAQVKALGDEVDGAAGEAGGRRRRRPRGRGGQRRDRGRGATASRATTCAASRSRPATRSARAWSRSSARRPTARRPRSRSR